MLDLFLMSVHFERSVKPGDEAAKTSSSDCLMMKTSECTSTSFLIARVGTLVQ